MIEITITDWQGKKTTITGHRAIFHLDSTEPSDNEVEVEELAGLWEVYEIGSSTVEVSTPRS